MKGFKNLYKSEKEKNKKSAFSKKQIINQAIKLHKEGDISEATKYYQKIIKEGYDVKRIVNYRTIHNENFDEHFVKELKLNMPDIVYVYSQNSASSLLKFIKFNQSETLWMNTNLMCIGEKTSAILNEIKWKKIFLFNPGEEEFLLYKI